jgi:hypothetical protein
MRSDVRGGGGPAAGGTGVSLYGNMSEYANKLAKAYGLDVGGEPIVDERGNITRTPKNEQEAMQLSRLATAVSNEMNRHYEAKAMGTLQMQAGLTRSRAPGSLAALQSGAYSQMASIYANTDISAGNFDQYVAYYQGLRAEKIAERMVKAAKYKMYGDYAMAAGNVISAAACWVAEELFGVDDERTHFARFWVFRNQQHWFAKLYIRHGRTWAAILRRFPILKLFMRPIWERMAVRGMILAIKEH